MEESFYHRDSKGSTSIRQMGRAAGLFILTVYFIVYCGCAGVSKSAENKEPPLPFQQIEESIKAGDPRGALQQYRDYLRSHPDSPVDRLLLARLLLAAGCPEEARSELAVLIEETGVTVEALLTLSYLENLTGNPDRERELLEQALEIDPANPTVLARLGNYHLEAGEYQRAGDLFRSALETDPEEATALRGLGVVLLNQEKYSEAIEMLDKAVQADPGNALNYADRGRAQAGLRNREEAVRDLSKAIELDPDFYWNYIDRGRQYLQLRRFEDAEADFSRAIQIDPELFLPYVYRAGLYDRLDRRSQAIADYRRVLQLNPEYIFAYAPLGVLYYLEEEWEPAAQAFQEAYRYEPEEPSYALLAALSWMQLGKREQFEVYLTEQLGSFPEDGWSEAIARYFLEPALEARTITAVDKETNKLKRARMLFFIASRMLLEQRVETALRYLLLVGEIDRRDLPEKRIAEELLRRFGYDD
jgi:tetratricopeptide (TPR) repeat protein